MKGPPSSGPGAEDDSVEIGELSRSLGFLTRMAQLQIFSQFYAALGELGLKPGEFSVLWVIGLNPGVRQGAVARRLQIKPAHMTKLIQRLEAAGFVARHAPAEDRRAIELTLTAQGEQFVVTRKADFFGYYRMDDMPLSAQEFDQFRALLQKFTGFDGDRP